MFRLVTFCGVPVDQGLSVSAKITIIRLDGVSYRRSKSHALRLEAAGTHEWAGDSTLRQTRRADQVPSINDRISPVFAPDYFYPEHQAHPELFDLPFTYPLPFEILKHYEGGRVYGRSA
jgi:hypothetical protein